MHAANITGGQLARQVVLNILLSFTPILLHLNFNQ